MSPDFDRLCRGVTRISWSYVFAFLNINLGTLDILPDWAAFLLIFGALNLLAEEERDLLLLKPFCVLLGVWEGAAWLFQALGGTFSLYPVDLIVRAVSLYFYFQLLTDLARLAERYAGESLARRIRRLRSVQVVFDTLMAAYLYLVTLRGPVELSGGALNASMWVILIFGFVLTICIMVALFDLGRVLAARAPQSP